MSRQSKTASAAVAALVVAGAAALVPLVGPVTVGSGATAGAVPVLAVRHVATTDAASGRPASTGPGRTPPTVIFLGDSAAWHPPGGPVHSYACRAAASLGWRCDVAFRSTLLAPAQRADVVVVLLTARDDAATLAATLDALPRSSGARTIVLAPIAVTTGRALAARLPSIRRLAGEHGAAFVDPVAERWLTAGTRARYLAADGVRPTAAGVIYLASRLAQSLRGVLPTQR